MFGELFGLCTKFTDFINSFIYNLVISEILDTNVSFVI